MHAAGWDPFVLLNRLASHGLEGVRIAMKLDDELVHVTDRELEAVLTESYPPGLDPKALRAALDILAIDATQARKLVERAKAGEEWAQRAYEAVVLRELVRYRGRARKLVADFLAQRPAAIAAVQEIRRQALADESTMGRQRARAMAFVIRDAFRAARSTARTAPAAKGAPPSDAASTTPVDDDDELDEAAPAPAPATTPAAAPDAEDD